MKIIIGHLFYDLLNLYGESGNVLALKCALESQGVQVEIKNYSLNNDWDFNDIDFIYIGTGTESNQKIALGYLKKHADKISEYIENNKFFLATGNSIELFGEYILNSDAREEMLGIFDYYTEKSKERHVSECIFRFEKADSEILGLENNQGKTMNSNTPWFKIEKGFGTGKDTGEEGFCYKNFYATYLIGPILARNPEILENLSRYLISSKDENFKFREFDFEIEKEAHTRYLKKYILQ